MASLTKTVQTPLISLQSVASAAYVIGTELDVSTLFAGIVGVHFGRRAATALTVPCVIRIEASLKAAGQGHWFPLAIFNSDTAACEAEAVSGTVNGSQAVITVASTTNLTAQDILFADNGTIGNSEWIRVKSIVSNTSVTAEDNLVNAQTGATLYDSAQIVAFQLDLSAVKRLRAVVDNSGTGQAVAVEVELITLDSIG